MNIIRLILIIFFIVVTPLTFFGFAKYSNIELRPYFDLLFICVFLFSLTKLSKNRIRYFKADWIILLIYLISYSLSTILMVGLSIFTIPTLKILLYLLIILTVASSNAAISRAHITQLFKVIIYLVFIKYAVSLTLGLNTRPIFFTENNFEVIFFTTMFLCSIAKPELFEFKKGFRIATFLTIVMSGSASGALGLISSVSLLKFKDILRSPIIIFIGSLVCIFPLYLVFSKFSNGLEAIDRYQYIIAAIATLSERSYPELILGPGYIKPMAAETCKTLSYLSTKITPEGQCFSSILSVGLLRQTLDFGLIPILLGHVLLFRIFRFYKVPKNFSLALLVLVIANGLSVSGLGNQFWILSVLYVLYMYRGYKLHPRRF